MHSIASEMSSAVRRLLRHPGHTLALTGVLAVGLALALGMFEGFNAYLLRPIPVPTPDAVMFVHIAIPEQGIQRTPASIHDLVDWRQRQRAFDVLAGFYQGTINLGGVERPERLAGTFVTGGFFEALGVAPQLGRAIRASDCVPGAAPVVVLGHAVWQRSFASDPDIVGRSVRINGLPAEVIGVMPAGFRLPEDEDAWTSLAVDADASTRGSSQGVNVIGRLASGVSSGRAQAELASIAETLAKAFPETNAGRVPVVLPYTESYIDGQTRGTVSALFISTVLVLLVACANVANLIIARLAARGRELSVRSALGASTLRLVSPVFAECLLVSLVAAAIGFGLSRVWLVWVTDTLQRADATRPSWVQFDPDWRSAVFAAAAAIACTVLAGLLPAWRLAKRDPIEGLRGSGRGAIGSRLGRMSHVLVGVEVALACVVVACAGLMMRSAINVRKTPLGARTEGVLTGRIGLFPADYPTDTDCTRFFYDLREHLRGIPGATGVALSTSLPGAGSPYRSYLKEGDVAKPGRRPPYARFVAVSPGYFETLEVPLLAGRVVVEGDTGAAPPVAVISAALAERLGGAQSVLGTRLQLSVGESASVRTVVGVVGNVQQGRIDDDVDPTIYVPLAQTPARFVSLLVRTAGDPSLTGEELRAVVRKTDTNLPVYFLQPLTAWAGQRIVLQQFLASMFGMFAAAGLFFAVSGLFAVLAQAVSGRTAEIGLRRALGASGSEIVSLIASQNGFPVGLGVLAGSGLGIALAHLIARELVGVRPTDPVSVVLGAFAVVLGAAFATWIPARRAVRIEPATALRTE